ncbi:MAG TPA: hypothetical protein VE075_04600, partial [Thermoanaerobaculia bacterium]|nr:hypothetical protein [Thermoanaerobaculia bacterium]
HRSGGTPRAAMHPTIFQLQAFGTARLPLVHRRAVLRHLRSGCGKCRRALAPRLIPWMDEEPAAEAASTDAAGCGPALAAAYLRAAARAARAGASLLAPSRSAGPAARALAILNEEGPQAIGRLPRSLLGMPAIEALLQQTYEMGPANPRLRIRLAELTYDLASTARGTQAPLEQARCRALIELANAYRVALDLRSAEQLLARAEERISRDGFDPLVTARLLFCQSLLLGDQSRPGPARAAIAAAISIYRREARRQDLARALGHDSLLLSDVLHDWSASTSRARQVLLLLGPDEEPLATACALHMACYNELQSGNWREALAMLRRHRRSMALHDHGRNRARFARMEGELLGHEGDLAGAASAFTFSRGELEAIGQPYEAGTVALIWASVLRRSGDVQGAQAMVMEATGSLLRLELSHEVYAALMLLRTTNRFSSTREEIPLEAMVRFLSHAEFNPSVRFQPFLA